MTWLISLKIIDLVEDHEAVAVDLDELEQGYEDVISNMTKNMHDIKSVKKEVRELHEELDGEWFDRGDQISVSVSGVVLIFVVMFVIFLWRRAGVPA